jgi:hypothetical protein
MDDCLGSERIFFDCAIFGFDEIATFDLDGVVVGWGTFACVVTVVVFGTTTLCIVVVVVAVVVFGTGGVLVGSGPFAWVITVVVLFVFGIAMLCIVIVAAVVVTGKKFTKLAELGDKNEFGGIPGLDDKTGTAKELKGGAELT